MKHGVATKFIRKKSTLYYFRVNFSKFSLMGSVVHRGNKIFSGTFWAESSFISFVLLHRFHMKIYVVQCCVVLCCVVVWCGVVWCGVLCCGVRCVVLCSAYLFA